MNSPIAVFLYNRPDKSYSCLKSLSQNQGFNDSPLYIFIDGPKSNKDKSQIEGVKKIVADFEFKNLKKVQASNSNKGLANSVFQGVEKILNLYDTVIVIEDDLILSPLFLNFMNKCLKKYNTNDIYQVSGYVWGNSLKKLNKPFLIPNVNSWGWATWKSKWESFKLGEISKHELSNFDLKLIKKFNLNNSYNYFKIFRKHISGKVDSWAIQWYYFVFINKGYTIYPHTSLVVNNGMDGSGTHTLSSKFNNRLDLDIKISYPKNLSYDSKIFDVFCNDLKEATNETLFKKIVIRVLYFLRK
jgi:hypothetical protein